MDLPVSSVLPGALSGALSGNRSDRFYWCDGPARSYRSYRRVGSHRDYWPNWACLLYTSMLPQMMLECAVYGFTAGLLFRLVQTKYRVLNLYISPVSYTHLDVYKRQARSLIRRVDRDELLQAMVKEYLND